MPYVIFDAATQEVRSAIAGPAPSDPGPGLEVGEVDDIQVEGALKNYVFTPDGFQSPGVRPLRGRVQRKPEHDWDLEAEECARARQQASMRFHQLDIDEVRKVEVHLMVPSKFSFLEGSKQTYELALEGIALQVKIARQAASSLDVHFEFGGYTVPVEKSMIRFDLTGREDFIRSALESQLGTLDDVGRKLFASQAVRAVCLEFGLRVANHVIDCYRIAYDDPVERPIGPADLLAGAVVIELHDGLRQAQHSGISFAGESAYRTRARTLAGGETPKSNIARDERLRGLLKRSGVPFSAIALLELRKARLHGQYRECVVWAATIIANVIDDILLKRLPKDSPEYRQLKNKPAKVRGATRRGTYFKKATGRTLAEWLEEFERQAAYGKGLAKSVEKILHERNLLLHRRKVVGPQEAQLAFETCMKFLSALRYGVPLGPGKEGFEL